MVLNFNDALEKVLELASQKKITKIVPLLDALDKVVLNDILCTRDLPTYNNAALDGYAIKYEQKGKTLLIKDEIIYAGVVVAPTLQNNECYKIMTGAKIPEDADTVVRFEDIEKIDDKYIKIPKNIKKNDAFRVQGEECKVDEVLIKKGQKLKPAHIALLASQGISYVEVAKEISISVLSTGNEIKEPYEHASQNEFYNINAYAILSLLKSFGFNANYGGIVPDTLLQTKDFFAKMKNYDVVISSGGVSTGEADFVKDGLSYNGFLPIFTGVNLKPGRPTIVGKMENTTIFSMPGNPLSAFLNTFLFVIPALKKMNGNKDFLHKNIKAINQLPFNVKGGKTNLVLGNLENEKFYIYNNAKVNSGMIIPLSKCNAIALLPELVEEVGENETIDIYLI